MADAPERQVSVNDKQAPLDRSLDDQVQVTHVIQSNSNGTEENKSEIAKSPEVEGAMTGDEEPAEDD